MLSPSAGLWNNQKTWHKIVIDGEDWYYRAGSLKDKALVAKDCPTAFFQNHKVFVKNEETAKKLDRGLMCR